jgi:NAD(P)-dependent dehydrogenase (short-subunit alcohol dehydrogenase family)
VRHWRETWPRKALGCCWPTWTPGGWTSWSPSCVPAAPTAWRSPATWPTLAAVHALADTALQAWGGADVVINNAGVGLVAPVQSLALADAHWLMNINFWGVVHGSRAFTRSCRLAPAA